MAKKWHTAKAEKGQKSWKELLTLRNGDLIEGIVKMEDGGVMTPVLVAGRVQDLQPIVPNGQRMDLVFIGSDDQETNDHYELNEIMGIHVGLLEGKLKKVQVADDDVLIMEKFRVHSLASMRKLPYLSDEALEELAPATAVSKAQSLERAKQGGKPKGGKRPAAARLSPSPKKPRKEKPFASLMELADDMRRPVRRKRHARSQDLSDDEEEEEDELDLRKTDTAKDVHRLSPGRLGFDIVTKVNEEYSVETGFLPVMRSHTVQMIRGFGKEATKFKSLTRELLTQGRELDHLITFLVRWEVENQKTDFKPTNELADLWRCLDVGAQRWSALEYVLTKQIDEPDVPAAKLWDALKNYELEPQTGAMASKSTIFDASVKTAQREDKIFGKVKR